MALIQIIAFLLPGTLLILGLAYLSSKGRDEWLVALAVVKTHWKGCFITGLVISFLLVDLPYLLSQAGDFSSKPWKFWLQTVAGNWSPDTPLGSKFEYDFSAVIAILLNNSLFFVIIGLIWRLLADRRNAMDVATALLMRDSFTRVAVRKLAKEKFPDSDPENILKIFDKALAKARVDLARHLPSVTEEAPQILAILQAAEMRRKNKSPNAPSTKSDASYTG